MSLEASLIIKLATEGAGLSDAKGGGILGKRPA